MNKTIQQTLEDAVVYLIEHKDFKWSDYYELLNQQTIHYIKEKYNELFTSCVFGDLQTTIAFLWFCAQFARQEGV